MNNSLQLFEYEDQQVRTVLDEHGNPWFVITDVCRILDLSNPTMAAKRLRKDRLSTTESVNSIGRKRQSPTTNEAGVYQLVFQSRKSEAHDFQDWVTSEVLPAIRQTGSYGVPAPVPALPQSYAAALRELASTHEAKEAAEQQLAVAAPKVAAYRTFFGADDEMEVSDAAKLLVNEHGIKTGRNRLFRWMREHDWIEKKQNRAKQGPIDRDWLRMRATNRKIWYRDGTWDWELPQVVVTNKGVERIHKMMLKQIATSQQAPAVTTGRSKASSKPRQSIAP